MHAWTKGMLLGIAALLSGCHSIVQRSSQHGFHVSIRCSGAIHCVLERLNESLLIDLEAPLQLQPMTLDSARVTVQQDKHSLQFVQQLSVLPGQHELVIRYYPVTPLRAETFSVIHYFEPQRQYNFHLYRSRNPDKTGNVLAVSMPDPLCVDIYAQQKVIRRFCRTVDAATGLGEFKEQQM